MLISFLEQGNILANLSRNQMFEVEGATLLYLLKCISFREALKMATDVLDEDQEYLRVGIKAKLSRLIEDADCNSLFKPAILRLATGDATGFNRLNAPTGRTQKIIDRYKDNISSRIQEVAFPIKSIGPKHLARLELEHLSLVKPHAKNYVYHYARFLTKGDSCLSLEDLTNDLIALALRGMRWYYPFLSGLHLTNTMRRTITNRGRGLITYYTAESRQRRVIDEDGNMTNMESGFEFDAAVDSGAWSENPTAGHTLKISLNSMARDPGTSGLLAKFMLDEVEQERFCAWLEQHLPACVGSRDVASAVQKSGRDYASLLSTFFKLPLKDVRQSLKLIQEAA